MMEEVSLESEPMIEASCSTSLPPPNPPHPVPARASSSGYDVELLSPPPPSFQVDCPICLKVLRKPCVISCTCGKKTCSDCIEPIKTSGRPCPFCNVSDFTFMRDFGLERYLSEFDILCEYRGDGCVWSGKLGDFDKHVNQDPTSEEALLEGCRFVPLKCGNCEEYYIRDQLKNHKENYCRKRKYTCKYCTTHTSTFDEVTSNHYSDCGSYPITCSQSCGKEMMRQELQGHLDDECPLAIEKCLYAFAGCPVELPRKDLRNHSEETALHLKLLASFTQNLLGENKELKEMIAHSNLKHEKTTERLTIHLSNVRQNCRSLRAEMERKGNLPMTFWVKRNVQCETLPHFFSEEEGYKMFVKVYPKGHGSGVSTHLSLYAGLMRGPNDDQLDWPFRGRINLQILKQVDGASHRIVTIEFNAYTPYRCCYIDPGDEETVKFGHDKVMSHTELDEKFVKGGHIAIQVRSVT